jgi:hypothetical protein
MDGPASQGSAKEATTRKKERKGWFEKQPDAIKAAIIAGIFSVVVAVIGSAISAAGKADVQGRNAPGRPPESGIAVSSPAVSPGGGSSSAADVGVQSSSPTVQGDGVSSGAVSDATIFNDVVTIDKKTGVDVDGGIAKKLYRQDAVADLYLDWGYILYSSVRNSAIYDDSAAGDEAGAHARCRTYRLDGTKSVPHTYVGGNAQYCFTTSDGHPAWVQPVNEIGDGGLAAKVVVWKN